MNIAQIDKKKSMFFINNSQKNPNFYFGFSGKTLGGSMGPMGAPWGPMGPHGGPKGPQGASLGGPQWPLQGGL